MQDNDTPDAVRKLKEWLSAEKEILTAAGVATIVGTYSGEGDEGRFEEIVSLTRDGLPANYAIPEDISALIVSLEEELARPGYEIDDGGGGTFVLNVEQTSLIHESYDVVIERCQIKRPEVRRLSRGLPGHT